MQVSGAQTHVAVATGLFQGRALVRASWPSQPMVLEHWASARKRSARTRTARPNDKELRRSNSHV